MGEYGLVDPRPNQRTVECFARDAACIFQPVKVGEDGRLDSSVLAGDAAQDQPLAAAEFRER